MFSGGPIPEDRQWTGWTTGLTPGQTGVYDVFDPHRRICQIGAADSVDIQGRLASRFHATHKSRLQHADCMWFVYDLLMTGQAPGVRIHSPNDGETPVEAEIRIREDRLRKGWQVASLR